MNILDYILNNWYLIILDIALLVVLIEFIRMPSKKKIQLVSDWLVYAVKQAEDEFGSGTGKVKLEYVYDKFTKKYPVLAVFMKKEKFMELVDDALEKLREKCIVNDK